MPTTHSPGPWEIYHSTWHQSQVSSATVEGDRMKTTVESLRHEADAALIAAAPELLDVLTMALPYVEMAEHDDSYKPGVVAKMVQRMNDAIAKAEGGVA